MQVHMHKKESGCHLDAFVGLYEDGLSHAYFSLFLNFGF